MSLKVSFALISVAVVIKQFIELAVSTFGTNDWIEWNDITNIFANCSTDLNYGKPILVLTWIIFGISSFCYILIVVFLSISSLCVSSLVLELVITECAVFVVFLIPLAFIKLLIEECLPGYESFTAISVIYYIVTAIHIALSCVALANDNQGKSILRPLFARMYFHTIQSALCYSGFEVFTDSILSLEDEHYKLYIYLISSFGASVVTWITGLATQYFLHYRNEFRIIYVLKFLMFFNVLSIVFCITALVLSFILMFQNAIVHGVSFYINIVVLCIAIVSNVIFLVVSCYCFNKKCRPRARNQPRAQNQPRTRNQPRARNQLRARNEAWNEAWNRAQNEAQNESQNEAQNQQLLNED